MSDNAVLYSEITVPNAAMPENLGAPVPYFPYREDSGLLFTAVETTTPGETPQWQEYGGERVESLEALIETTAPGPDGLTRQYFLTPTRLYDITSMRETGTLDGYDLTNDRNQSAATPTVGLNWRLLGHDDYNPITRIVHRAQQIPEPHDNIFFMPAERENPFAEAREIVMRAEAAARQSAVEAAAVYDQRPQAARRSGSLAMKAAAVYVRASNEVREWLTSPEYKQDRRITGLSLLGGVAALSVLAGAVYASRRGYDASHHASSAMQTLGHGHGHYQGKHARSTGGSGHHLPLHRKPKAAEPTYTYDELNKNQNPWTMSDHLLNQAGDVDPSNQQILSVDNQILHLNHMTATEARHIPTGTELKVPILRRLASIRSLGRRALGRAA